MERGHKVLAIGGMPDHIHIFNGPNLSETIPDLVRELKKSSTKFITEQNLCATKFQWQSGYGAFSYSRSHRDAVIKYILNQKKHHAEKSFKAEYLKMLKDFEVEAEKKIVFDFID